jgi:hypothetical protein
MWMERGEALWKVSLSGSSDWIEQIRRHELNSYAKIARCDERDFTVFAFGPYVGRVEVSTYGNGFRDFNPTADQVRYDLYLSEASRYRSEADPNAPMPPYDLGKGRMALCIKIAGGAMHGAYAESNEVRVTVGN